MLVSSNIFARWDYADVSYSGGNLIVINTTSSITSPWNRTTTRLDLATPSATFAIG